MDIKGINLNVLRALFVAVLLLAPCATAGEVSVTQSHMGMSVTLTAFGDDDDAAREACRVAFERVGELNLIFSDYEPRSELSALYRKAGQGPVKVSDELFEVLAAATRLAELTDGAFDPTAAPVIRLWREARRTHVLPSDAAIAEAMKLVGHEKMVLDAEAKTVELTTPGMLLDLGAIAKGYVGDEAIRVMRERGFPAARFAAGGDVVVGDAPPGTDGWLIEPEGFAAVTVSNAAVAISGDSVQYVEIDGRRYGHVIDARTGWPMETVTPCAVVAPRGLDADPLSTIGTIVDSEAFADLVRGHFPEVCIPEAASQRDAGPTR